MAASRLFPRPWLTASLAVGLLYSVGWQSVSVATETSKAAAPDAAKQRQSLLEERRDTLRQLVKHVASQYASGTTNEEAVIRASNQLIEAELDLARTKPERIALFEKMADNLRRLEQRTEAGYKAGHCTRDEALAAKAARLQGEIALARERTREP